MTEAEPAITDLVSRSKCVVFRRLTCSKVNVVDIVARFYLPLRLSNRITHARVVDAMLIPWQQTLLATPRPPPGESKLSNLRSTYRHGRQVADGFGL